MRLAGEVPLRGELVSEHRGQAAVMVIMRIRPEGRSVLLTKRSAHLSAHPGEVAFPGGKWEVGDPDLMHTALRETLEEVAIPPYALHVHGVLPVDHTKRGTAVTPFVAELLEDVPLIPDPAELSSLFWMPEEALLRDERVRTDVFMRDGTEYWAPAYRYLRHHIWGLTARVLVRFMNEYWHAGIGREHAAPELRYK